MKKIIYSCVFYNDSYINLINILLKSYILFGKPVNEIEYLIICNPDFKDKIQQIYDKLKINGKIWCLDLKTKFESGYCRLKIFEYIDIHLYEKILYLDCDVLMTNDLSNIFNNDLEDKLYALKEGNTSNRFWGGDFFKDKNPNIEAFSSGVLLFNNCSIMKKLFNDVLQHIQNHLDNNLRIPKCLDQPFIVYNAITNNLYNNEKLIGIIINNPKSYNKETICHFPGHPGWYDNKRKKMSRYMNSLMFMARPRWSLTIKINPLINKKYKWEESFITFLETGKMIAFGDGYYKFLEEYLIYANFGEQEHLLKFNKDYSEFISIRKYDFEVVNGLLTIVVN